MSPEEFRDRLRRCGVFSGAKVLAAVSGGADSVCLLWLLAQVREEFPLEVVCAHAEHGLRGADSLEDMQYVLRLCEKWNIPFFSEHLDVRGYSRVNKTGTEEAARELRHAFLKKIAEAQKCDFIALAHHRRDQAETVLLRAVRGTDIHGLAAMREKNGSYIRPLLECDPMDLRELLLNNGISWREDATNADVHYSRNRVRLNVLPELRRISPDADAALCRLASAAARDEDFFSERLEELGLTRPVRLADGAALPAGRLKGLHPALMTRALSGLLRAAGADADSDVIAKARQMLSENAEGSLNLPEDGRFMLDSFWAAVVFPDLLLPETELLPGMNETPFGNFLLEKSAPDSGFGDGILSQRIPWEPSFRLSVGTRRAGEQMVPFGRSHPCELRKLIAGTSVPQAMRRSVPVIRVQGNPVWLAGVRPSEWCRQNGKENWMLRFMGKFPWSWNKV